MRPRHEAVWRRIVAAAALASLLTAALAPPAAASPAEGGSGGPAVGVDATEVRLLTGDLVMVQAFPDGQEGIEVAVTISADGALAAFMSSVSNLVPADTNGQPDIFVRYRGEE